MPMQGSKKRRPIRMRPGRVRPQASDDAAVLTMAEQRGLLSRGDLVKAITKIVEARDLTSDPGRWVSRWYSGERPISKNPFSREDIAQSQGFESWRQFSEFVLPSGQYVLQKELLRDLPAVWRYLLQRGATQIVETRIGLSHHPSFKLGFSADVDAMVRTELKQNLRFSMMRVEQVSSLERLAELCAHVEALEGTGYRLRVLPPSAVSVPYPNLLRIGDFLIVGRSHMVGAPSAMEPMLVLQGEGATAYCTSLAHQLWDAAEPFTFGKGTPVEIGEAFAESYFPGNGARARFREALKKVQSTYQRDPPRL